MGALVGAGGVLASAAMGDRFPGLLASSGFRFRRNPAWLSFGNIFAELHNDWFTNSYVGLVGSTSVTSTGEKWRVFLFSNRK